MFKKITSFVVLGIFLLFVLTACGSNKENKDIILYKNIDLQFEIQLTNDFKYYQTQRVKTGDFVDVDFFVPTSDQSYGKEVPGYAKPFTIRVFNNNNDSVDNGVYENIGSGNNKLYTIRFWSEVPQDWQNIWSKEMENRIKNSFKIN